MTGQHQRRWTSGCPDELTAMARAQAIPPEFYLRCVCGDLAAFDFLLAYHEYAHLVDDLADGDEEDRGAAVIRLTRLAQVLWAKPFYRAHEPALSMVSCLVRSLYANSVAWSEGNHPYAVMADTLRFAGNLMIEACAVICGGDEHQRRVSETIWAMSWAGHHDADGKSI